ncbi:Gluconolactonase [Pararobbsia alpina]|uniref:SMP-30/gluconolactonase/LRE family protein n=1 Tax=Pararobbsia alpina TaxID=621374 RepID=UPI0039A6A816
MNKAMAWHEQLDIVARELSWPEAPRWHDGALYFSDCHHFRVMRVRPGEAPEKVADLPGRPSGMGFFPDGRLLVAGALDRKLWWVAPGRVELAADLSAHATGLLNDMIVDANGRAWVGDTGFDLAAGGRECPGTLLSWSPQEGVRRAAECVRFPNGMAITPDGKTLFLAETFASAISAFDIASDGTLSNRRIHAELEGRPDGMCLDDTGGLWVALLWNQAFHRIDTGGRITHRLEFEHERCISCVIGADTRQTLFLGTSAIVDDGKVKSRGEGFIKRIPAPFAGSGIP